jgi:GNAT superfamily N-acetyltransferase
MASKMRLAKEPGYFERNFEEQNAGRREIYIASYEGTAAGYCILNWEPKYYFFKKQGIPETQDLNVLPDLRKRGIATAMIAHCETRAREKGCGQMGISVGLHGAYGPAQILYVKLGYIPDGQGVTCDRRLVSSGEFKAVDDNLCLMMVKSL